ncbi:hypothetical protein NW754_000166 [Fusarium falciforme]|nr:hypothetical protein NW754_000166 [Fusarium falciforme]
MPPKEPPAPAPSQSRVSQTSSKRDETIPIQPLRTEGSQRSSQSATKIGSFVMPQPLNNRKPDLSAQSCLKESSNRTIQSVQEPKVKASGARTAPNCWILHILIRRRTNVGGKRTQHLSELSNSFSGHVVEDLSPYVCVYEDCDSPDAMYVTTLEWKKHIRERHSRAQWICDPCWLNSESPEEFEFDTEEEWHTHTLTEHKDEVEEDDLPDLAELSQRTGVPPIACPLCYEDASLRNPETDKHLAEHLHSFALQALPWEVTGFDDETQVSMGSVLRKSHDSGDIEESTPDKHQEDDDEMTDCQTLLTAIISRSRAGIYRIIPYERNSQFIARPELSEKIFGIIPTSYQFQSGALWGVGGSGKTQLALEYAYARCKDPNCYVFWVRADNAATFTADYHLIAKELGVEQHLKGDDLLAAVCSSIEAHQPWVLILDGADDLMLFNRKEDSEYFNSLFDFVPKGPRGLFSGRPAIRTFGG